MPVVITADQRRSRRGADRVPELVERLNAPARTPVHRAFERTAGDELQGVLSRPEEIVEAVGVLVRDGSWSVGIGLGDVEQPLPRSTRAGRGPAFVHARRAVEAAKTSPVRVAVVADDADAGRRLETVLLLWADLLGRRTPAGWEVVDLLTAGLTHAEAAQRLGVSQSAVSQRVATAGMTLSARGATLATDLLREMTGGER